MSTYQLSHLRALEAESIHILREVGAEFERPVVLFSGGKDSAVLLRLAEKAFWPAKPPFSVMHIDTGHNFAEALEFRDRRVGELGLNLIVASVQQSIDTGRAMERGGPTAPATGCKPSPCSTPSPSTASTPCWPAAGGKRRRRGPRSGSTRFRDQFGQWDPKNQRPEMWNLYNGRLHKGEHMRVFPISNWTELDVWQYIADEGIELPDLYFAHRRQVVRARRHAAGAGRSSSPFPARRCSRCRCASARSAT